MNSKEELLQKLNKIYLTPKFNQIKEQLEPMREGINKNESKESRFISEFNRLAPISTSFSSNNSSLFAQKESLSSKPNIIEIKHLSALFYNNDLIGLKESKNIENFIILETSEDDNNLERSKSLKNNYLKDNNENEEHIVNKDKNCDNFSFKDNKIHDRNENINSPPFFEKKEAVSYNKDIKNILAKKYIISYLSDKKMTKIFKNMINSSFPKDNIDTFVNLLSGSFNIIIKNKYGSYFCCDLIKKCGQKNRIKILKELSRNLSEDCLDQFGVHPIQLLVENSTSEEEYNLILYSFNDIDKLLIASLNPNGAYVVQKIIKYIPEKFRMKFNLIFISFLSLIVKEKFGVLNAKIFADYSEDKEIINILFNQIKAYFLEIAINKYGNFFIQHILKKWYNKIKGRIITDEIINNFRVLFENKYSTFICDLFLKLSNIEEKKQLMNSLNLNLINNKINENDKVIMIKIMNSFEKHFKFKNNKINSNNQYDIYSFPLKSHNSIIKKPLNSYNSHIILNK